MQHHLDLGLDNIPDILQYLSAPQLSVTDRGCGKQTGQAG